MYSPSIARSKSTTTLQRSVGSSIGKASNHGNPALKQLHSLVHSRMPVQLASVDVAGGRFRTMSGRYYAINDEHTPKKDLQMTGARIMLDFLPNDQLDAKTVSLVQTVNDHVTIEGESKPERDSARLSSRTVRGKIGKGMAIDQVPYDDKGNLVNLDPRYTEKRMTEKKALSKKPPPFPPPPPSPGYSSLKKHGVFSPALLKDQPAITHNMTSRVKGGMSFEVAALAEGGKAKKFVGSVKWGWKMNSGKAELIPLAKESQGTASAGFFSAADLWNQMEYEDKGGDEHETLKLPLSKFYLTLKRMPARHEKKMIIDRLKYNFNMQKMLDEKIALAHGERKKPLQKAKEGWKRMFSNGVYDLIQNKKKLDKLAQDIQNAKF